MKPNVNIAIATAFIDAFYSFNRAALKATLTHAKAAQPNILYYQEWARCGNYVVLERHEFIIKDTLIICPITVKDDLIAALGININVTDTFHITIINGQIQSVENYSNDPDLYYEAKEWVKKNRTELIEKPCLGIWNGGPTPCKCVKAMIQGLLAFKENNPTKF